MANRLAQIQEAIDRFHMDRARALVDEELAENPSADAYYLASQAALNHGQRVAYLRKTLELDSDYQPAIDELADIMPEKAKARVTVELKQEPQPPSLRLASFGRRWLAILIDGLIIAIPTMMLGFGGLSETMDAALLTQDESMVSAAFSQFQSEIVKLNLVLSAVYNVAFMVIFNGQTLGKIMLKLRVVKKNGRRVGIWDALLRNVLGYNISGIFPLGYLWALLDPELRTWHDRLAGTVVIDERG